MKTSELAGCTVRVEILKSGKDSSHVAAGWRHPAGGHGTGGREALPPAPCLGDSVAPRGKAGQRAGSGAALRDSPAD